MTGFGKPFSISDLPERRVSGMSEAKRNECTLHPLVLRVRRELTRIARSKGYHPDYRQGCWVGRCLLNDALKTWRKQNNALCVKEGGKDE